MIEAHAEHDVMVRMLDGESLVDSLLSVELESAIIVGGIGMVRDATLAYWNGSEYEEHIVKEPVELLAMQGTIGRMDGKPIAHCHLTVARRDGSVTGGHLVAATVANTAEVALKKLPGIALERSIEANGLAGLRPRSLAD